jgi:hypothetical protein
MCFILPDRTSLTKRPTLLVLNAPSYTKRRALWNLLRVEWENLKQQTERVEKEDVSDEDDEKASFLPPAGTQMAATANSVTAPAKRPNSMV